MDFALQTENLGKVFVEGTVALRDVSLRARHGEFLTLLGPSGSGKTTVLRLLAGFEKPSSGSIQIGQQLVADGARFVPPEARKVGMVFQDYALFPHVTVAGNIGFGLRNGRAERESQVRRMLDMIGLPGYAERMPHELSGGQQQRVALARALAPKPEVLLLDEPFSNLDTDLRLHIRNDVRQILRETGTTAIFVTHDQEEALSLSDEIAVIYDGSLLQVAAPHIIYNRPRSIQVAKLVGEANVLPAQAHGMTASSCLGEVKLYHPRQGAVQLMIRPEALHIDHLDEVGVMAAVQWREFFGHNQRLGLALADGTELVAWTGVERYIRRGDEVRVSLGMPALAYDEIGSA